VVVAVIGGFQLDPFDDVREGGATRRIVGHRRFRSRFRRRGDPHHSGGHDDAPEAYEHGDNLTGRLARMTLAETLAKPWSVRRLENKKVSKQPLNKWSVPGSNR
jgi:hypothetical protein